MTQMLPEEYKRNKKKLNWWFSRCLRLRNTSE